MQSTARPKALTGEAPRPPSSREGDRPAGGGRSERRSARPRGLGGDFEFLPLKSPRNPITPIKTSRVATLHPGLYTSLRAGTQPPQDLPLRGRGTARRRWKELKKTFSKLHMLHIHHMPDTHQAYDVFFSFFSSNCVLFPQTQPPEKTTFPVIPLNPSP